MAEISTGEALQKLEDWGISGQNAFDIVQRLINERFIDNERYARAYVRDRVNNARWGINKIRMSLRQKGVEPEIISLALEEELDQDTYFRNLSAALRSKGGRMPSPLSRENYAKLARFATSRGYEAGLVSEMLADERYWRDDESAD